MEKMKADLLHENFYYFCPREYSEEIELNAVVGKCTSLELVDGLYKISIAEYNNLIVLLDADEAIPQSDIRIFKKSVTLVTGVSAQDSKHVQLVEKLPHDVPHLDEYVKPKSQPLRKMVLQYDQNDVTTRSGDDPMTFVRFLLEIQLLEEPPYCRHCQHTPLLLERSSHFKCDGCVWKCTKCDYYYSVRKNSFFENHHLSLVHLFRMQLIDL